jgi:preprotein translocase subunit SecF
LLYTLLIGVIVGTYSSIAIASQLLLVWEERGMMPFRRREEAEA